MADERFPDEDLDNPIPDENEDDTSSDDTGNDENSEDQDDTDESQDDTDTESDDEDTEDDTEDTSDESDDDDIDTRKRDAIKAERERRKKAERERDEALAQLDKTKEKPKVKLSRRESLINDHFEGRAESKLALLIAEDPTARTRVSEIKKILFEEKPYLLKEKDGVQTADEIAKGRMISITSDEKTAPVKQKTSGAPRKPDKQKPRPMSQKEYDKMSPDEQRAWEDQQILKHAGQK